MEILAGLIAAAGVAAVPAAVAAWLVERWRFGRRNADGRCAVCARPWDESPSDDRFLIHGRLT